MPSKHNGRKTARKRLKKLEKLMDRAARGKLSESGRRYFAKILKAQVNWEKVRWKFEKPSEEELAKFRAENAAPIST